MQIGKNLKKIQKETTLYLCPKKTLEIQNPTICLETKELMLQHYLMIKTKATKNQITIKDLTAKFLKYQALSQSLTQPNRIYNKKMVKKTHKFKELQIIKWLRIKQQQRNFHPQ